VVELICRASVVAIAPEGEIDDPQADSPEQMKI
jgi:hypothetical protein